jgi:hypothetical protein
VRVKDLPSVAVTAFVQKDDAQLALLAGFQVHLPKPREPHELTAVIARLAAHRLDGTDSQLTGRSVRSTDGSQWSRFAAFHAVGMDWRRRRTPSLVADIAAEMIFIRDGGTSERNHLGEG